MSQKLKRWVSLDPLPFLPLPNFPLVQFFYCAFFLLPNSQLPFSVAFLQCRFTFCHQNTIWAPAFWSSYSRHSSQVESNSCLSIAYSQRSSSHLPLPSLSALSAGARHGSEHNILLKTVMSRYVTQILQFPLQPDAADCGVASFAAHGYARALAYLLTVCWHMTSHTVISINSAQVSAGVVCVREN